MHSRVLAFLATGLFASAVAIAQITPAEGYTPPNDDPSVKVRGTIFLDYTFHEGIYRYRFQGQIFVEREGFLVSSDLGLSSHLAFPSNYGDIHVGVYNGEGYNHSETNDQKAFQVRLTLRPAPTVPVLRGLRL